MRIKKGDLVVITAGRERGLTGRVRKVLPKADRVIVEGRNVVNRHMRRGPQGQEGGILPKEAPIHASNVMLFSEKIPDGQGGTRAGGVRVSMRYLGAEDKPYANLAFAQESFGGEVPGRIRKVRFAPKTGEIFE